MCDYTSPWFWVALVAYCGVEYWLGKRTKAGSVLGVLFIAFLAVVGLLLILKEKYHGDSRD